MDTFLSPGPSYTDFRVTRFALRYVDLVVMFQNLAVLLLAPAYLATVVTEERDRHTLDMLFTTHLNDREIVLGKLTARMVHLGGVLLAALPILSLVQLLGGVSMSVLLANFVNTALLLAATSSFCLLMSVRATSSQEAVIRCYFWILLIAGGMSLWRAGSPLLMSQEDYGGELGPLLESMGLRLLVYGVLTVAFVVDAVASLRTDPVQALKSSQVAELSAPGRAKKEPARPLPAIGDENPLLWKEMNVGAKPFVLSGPFWVIVGGWLTIPSYLLVARGWARLLEETADLIWISEVYRFLFRRLARTDGGFVLPGSRHAVVCRRRHRTAKRNAGWPDDAAG